MGHDIGARVPDASEKLIDISTIATPDQGHRFTLANFSERLTTLSQAALLAPRVGNQLLVLVGSVYQHFRLGSRFFLERGAPRRGSAIR